MRKPLQQLYNALKSNNYGVPDTYDSFERTLTAKGQEGVKNRQQLYRALRANNYDVPDSYDSFARTLFTPTAKQNKQQRGTLMTDGERQKFIRNARNIAGSASGAVQRTKKQVEYAKKKRGLQVKTPVLGQNTNVVEGEPKYNEQGQKQSTYLTSAGNEYDNRALADMEQQQLDDPIGSDIRAAEAEQARLEELIQKRREQIDEERNDAGFLTKLARSLADVSTSGKVHPSTQQQDVYNYDKEYQQLMSALRKNKALQVTLRDKKSGQTNSFWHSLGDELTNGYTFSYGGENILHDAMAVQNAKKHINAINAKRQSGEKLTHDEEVAEALLHNVAWDNEVQAKYGDQYGAWARAGKSAATSIDMALDFALGMKGITGIAKGTSTFIAKQTLKALGKQELKGLGKYMLKSFGATVGSMAAGATLANTVQLPRLIGKTAAEHEGEIHYDENGNYQIDNAKSFLASLAHAERDLITEAASEVSGEFMNIGGTGIKLLKNIGLSKAAGWLTSIGAKGWYKNYNNILKNIGFHGLAGEGFEEYTGYLYNAIMGNIDDLSQLADAKTHLDIWLATVTYGSLLNAPNIVMSGTNAVALQRSKHNVNKADKVASYRLTPEIWQPIREQIDGAKNEDMTDVLWNIINNKELHAQQKQAVVDYAKNLQQMRGFSLGSVAQENAEQSDEEEKQDPIAKDADQSYIVGYNLDEADGMNDVKNTLDVATQRLSELLDEQTFANFAASPVQALQYIYDNEQWSDEDKQIAIDYVNARSAYDGMLQRVRDDIDLESEQIRQTIASRRHQVDGDIHPATMKVDDRQVYIINGNVRMMEDGTMIDRSRSDNDIIIIDANTGKIEFTSADQIERVEDVVNADELLQTSLANTQQTIATAAANKIDGKLPFNVGDVYTLPDEQGNTHTFTIMSDVGNGSVTVDVDGEIMQVAKESLQAMNDSLNMSRTTQEVEQTDEQEDAGDTIAAVPNEEQTAMTDEEDDSNIEQNRIAEEDSEVSDAMPMIGEGEDAEPDFMSVTPQRGHQYIYDEAGLPKEVADQFVVANIKSAEKEVEKINAKKPAIGTKLNEYRSKLAEWQNKADAAQATLQYWKDVQAEQRVIDGREQARRAELQRQETEQAIADEQQRQQEVIAKREEQERIGSNSVAPTIKEKWDKANKIEGASNEITLANGERVRGKYILVESGAATPSHNVNDNFKKSEGFPLDENEQSVNDRDYERDSAAQDITRQIAGNYDSRAIQTPVVVSNDGVVLSGNGRTMAGELAARDNTDGAYIDYLRTYPQQYGFTAEQVDSMQHPRVLFVPDEAMPYTTETFAKFNQQDMKGQSKTEQAVKLGKVVDDNTFGRIVRTINAYDTLGEFYSDTQATTQAIGELLKAGAINQMQYDSMFDGDTISEQGKEILENMLIGKAFESNPDAVRQLTAYKSLRQSVISALAEVSNNIALGEEYSLESELAEAIALAYNARQSGYKAGDKVSEFARQGNLFAFDDGATVADYTNATVMLLADVLNDTRVTRLKRFLTVYNDSAKESAAGQLDIFSGTVKDKQDIFNEINQLFSNGTEEQQQSAINQSVENRKSAASAERSGENESTEQADVSSNGSKGNATVEEPNAVQTALAAAEQETNTEPTDAQKEAGNYKKGHVKIDGYNITIENPKGSERSGQDKDGKKWSITMNNTYGYILGTEGVDGDHIDVFLSDNPSEGNVYIVDQVNADGSFDEHKVMYGFPDIESARKAYLSNYEEGWQGLGNITGVSKEEFKKWVDSSHRKTKPFAEYKNVKVEESNTETEEEVLPYNKENSERLSLESEKNADNSAVGYSVTLESKDGTLQRSIFYDGRLIAIQWQSGERIDSIHDVLRSAYNDAPAMNYDLYVPMKVGANESWEIDGRDVLDADHGDIIRFHDEQEMIDFYLKNRNEIDRRNETMQPQSAETRETALRDGLIDKLRSAGIEVITDEEEAQRVLDAANGEVTLHDEKVSLHKVFHGSGNDFERFDHSHIGEGEGAQAYGWGTYVTEVEGIGKTYAQQNAKEPIGLSDAKRRRADAQSKFLYDIESRNRIERESEECAEYIARNRQEIEELENERVELLKKYDEKSVEVRNWDFYNQDRIEELKKEIERNENRISNNQEYINQIERELPKLKTEYENAIRDVELLENQIQRVLYTVEIPEDAETYYLDYTLKMGDQQDILEGVDNALYAQGWHREELDSRIRFTKGQSQIILTPNQSGADLYAELENALGSDKLASEFLHDEVGVTGMKYPAEYRSGGRSDGSSNYVIFDEKDLKITDKIKFLRTDSGEVYGFTKDGKIYIDPRKATAETPVHEFTHLWADGLRKANPKAWEQLKNELEKEKDLFDYVKSLYPELSGDDLIDEVFAHFSGRRGAERLRSEQKKMMQKANGVFDKAKITTMFDKLRNMLHDFWAQARDLFAGKTEGIEKLSAEDFADMALADLIKGEKPLVEGKKETRFNKSAGENKSLMGVHNISAEKLSKAIKQGGLANPSLAVIDTDERMHNDYGEISLIPKAELLNAKGGRNAGTYLGDAWTPTYPGVTQFITKQGEKHIEALAKQLANGNRDVELYVKSRLRDYAEQNGSRLHLAYLLARGKNPELKGKETKYSHEEYEALEDIFGEGVKDVNSDLTEEQHAKLKNLIMSSIEKDIEERSKDIQDAETRNKAKEYLREIREKAWFDEEGRLKFAKWDSYVNNVKRSERIRQNPEIDWGSTESEAHLRILKEGLTDDYNNWLQEVFDDGDIEEKLFAGFTPSGNRRYLPNTVENASKLMNRNSDTNAYDNGGFSATRSSLLQKVTTLAQIRKNKGKLKASDEIEEKTREMSDRLFNIINQIADMQKISDNRFMNTDYAESRLQDAITKRDPIRYLNEEYGYDIDNDSDLAKEINDFIKDTKELPVKYFETKFKRPVRLDEFAIAVVPENTSPDIVNSLKAAGLDVRTYDNSNQQTSNEERERVTKEAVRERDDILFRSSEQLNDEYPTWLSGQTTETGQHTTQITSTVKSYERIGQWMKEQQKDSAKILDASSGLGYGTQTLRDMGFDVEDVEPYPSEKREKPTYLRYEDINGKYDVVISNAVLNVIPDDWRADILKNMADKLKIGGKLIINVRDAKSIENQKQKIELDSPSEILVTDAKGNIRAYQKGFTKKELQSWVSSELGEGWQVDIANEKNSGLKSGTAVVVTRLPESQKLVYREPEASKPKKTETITRKQAIAMRGRIQEIDNALEDENISEEEYDALMEERNSIQDKFNRSEIKRTPKEEREREEYARRQWDRAHEVAEEWTEKLNLNDDVQIVDELTREMVDELMPNASEEVKEKALKAKGWFNEKTGKIVIAIGNHRSPEDVMQTILHEGVAHYGLRKLFGENFNTFLDNVYATADVSVRQRIVELAAKHGYDFRTATEEYLAKLAETTNFEGHQKWWENIKRLFLDMLHAVGLRSFGENYQSTLSDNELRYILWRSYDNMTAQERNNDVFRQAKDIAMQTELKVGNYEESKEPTIQEAAEGDTNLLFREGEEESSYDAGKRTLEETLTQGLIDLANKNKNDVNLRVSAMKAIGGNLSKLRSAMSRQREYDKETVNSIVRWARMLMDNGIQNELTRHETKRLIGMIAQAAAKEDITEQAQQVMDLMIDSQLRTAKNMLNSQMKIRGSKIDAKGVEVQGKLDIDGQRMVNTFKEAINIGEEALAERISDALDRMGAEDEVTSKNAGIEYQGLMLAQQYNEEIKEREDEVKNIRRQIREQEERIYDFTTEVVKDENGNIKFNKEGEPLVKEKRTLKPEFKGKNVSEENRRIAKEVREFVRSAKDAIRDNKIERLESYQRMIVSLGDGLRESIERAKAFREEQTAHVQEIQHNANSDLEGMSASEHSRQTWVDELPNSAVNSFFTQPLTTFNEILRYFGRKSVDGCGYLWNRFMRDGFIVASDKEWRSYIKARKQLDAKASEVMGKKMKWNDLFSIARKMPTVSVEFWDAGERKTYELTQGNMLYIYMVNKMTDGKMKLRHMGITEEDVEAITDKIDPRFIQLADWVQNEFLKNKREDYNKVYERMFGAPMAAIENYFPLKISSKNRGEEVELSEHNQDNDKNPSTITGSVIKRKRNTKDLDITNADAFDVVLEHLQQMEHLAAFAELSRDLNTLLSYKKFQNRVKNMSSARFGAGETLWKKFKDVCAITTGNYTARGNNKGVDAAVVNIAKGVTAAKISLRLYTALKQLTSYPAYFANASIVELAKSTNPKGAVESWKWALENLPTFAKRWGSRQAGDTRLLQTDSDWSFWKRGFVEKLSRIGMSPNAFVDGLTVAMGAKAIYETRRKRYIKYGYSEEKANEKALRYAAISVNETQQSSEAAFTSAMQNDRTMASVMWTVFRNSSMGYQRKFVGALANLKQKMKKGYKEESIAFMAKQFERDGLTPEQAQRAAQRAYRRSWTSDVSTVLTFGFVMQFSWNLAPYLLYLFAGDDDDKKKEMWHDAFYHAFAGPVEGLTAGAQLSELYNYGRQFYVSDDKLTANNIARTLKNYNFDALPLMSDLQSVLGKTLTGEKGALNDIFNLVVQSGIGINPQTITDALVAIEDASNGDMGLGREIAFFLMRLMQTPQSTIDELYIDEVGLKGKDAKRLNVDELAKRYAAYKRKKGYYLTRWAYSDESDMEREGKIVDSFTKKVAGRLSNASDEEVSNIFNGNDITLKKLAGKEAAKRLGGKDSYGGKAQSDYQRIYQQKRNYFDLAEDVLLQTEMKKAKEAGDDDKAKDIQAARNELADIRKDLGTGNDDEVMRELRQVRKEILQEFGLTVKR